MYSSYTQKHAGQLINLTAGRKWLLHLITLCDYRNFRPITNLTTVSKILERLTLARLKPHIVSSPNYCPLQSAFRSAHSTETALVKMVDDILGCMDSGSVAVAVGLDISAAFDTVCHQTLLGRLES